MIDQIVQDFRYAARGFRRAPSFVFTVIGTLGLGIGATTTVFSVVDALVLSPLPYADASRLVQVGTDYSGSGRPSSVSPMNFYDWRAAPDRGLDDLVASRLQSAVMIRDGMPEQIGMAGVSAGFFELLGAAPLIGRSILPDDDRPGGGRVAVLRYGTWQRRWGGDPGVIGRTVVLTDRPYTIVGVMPPSFHPPEAIYQGDVEIWFPLALVDDDLTTRDNGFLQVLGRVERGGSVARAVTSLNDLQRRIYEEHPPANDRIGNFRDLQRVAVVPLIERTVGEHRRTLLVFLGAVGLLLAIACANVANLFLARMADRAREMGLRVALGAGRARIFRQLVTESLAISIAAGVFGLGLAVTGVRAFVALAPSDLPRLGEVAIDLRVLTFTVAVSVATGLVFGVAPFVRTWRGQAREALQEGGTTTTAGRQRHGLRRGLMAGQTAVTLVLLVGAGLLMTSFVRLTSMHPGFDPTGVYRLELYVGDEYPTGQERARFFSTVVERLAAVPGVEAAAATNNLPMTANSSHSSVTLSHRTTGEPLEVSVNRVTPGFFDALRIRRLAGRDFSATDSPGAEPVVIINEALARAGWTTEDPVGGRIKFGAADADTPWQTVVGVVAEIRHHGLDQPAGPSIYLPMEQVPFGFGNAIVRTQGDAARLGETLRQVVWGVNPRLPIETSGLLERQLAATVTAPRFNTVILVGFAAVAFALATVGVYGSVSYIAGQRKHEVGIRIALGAGVGRVMGLVMRQGMTSVTLGLTLGAGAAVGLSQVLSGLVFGVTTTYWPVYGAVTLLLAATAAFACWLPARRAARIDPMRTLRQE